MVVWPGRRKECVMIAPKDCTKEELIYFIEKCCIFNKENFAYNIKIYRSNKYCELSDEYFQKADKYQEEYISLLHKYTGVMVKDIPQKDIERMFFLQKEAEKAYAKSEEFMRKA